LIELAKLCSSFDQDFLHLTPECEYLVPFATKTRYPGTSNLDDKDITKALAYAQDIIETVKIKIVS